MFTTLSYEQGFEKAQQDFIDGLSPMILRGYSIEFRNGYSDGWHKASGGDKKW